MKYIDLFAGCGGLSLGLEKAGFKLALAVEKSDMAAETFYHNFIQPLDSKEEWESYCQKTFQEQAESRLVVGELRHVLDDDVIMEELSTQDIDLIAGGPPCQGFSMAGRRNPNDARNQLPWQFLEMVERVSPKAVIMENVVGMRRRFEKHGEDSPFEQLQEVLKKTGEGYVVQAVQLNAMHFGAPQHRPRIMLLALRNDIALYLGVTANQLVWESSLDDPAITPINHRPDLAPKGTHYGEDILTVNHALWDVAPEGYARELTDSEYSSPEGQYARIMREDTSWMNELMRMKNRDECLPNQTLRRHADHIQKRFRIYQILQQNNLSPKILNIPSDDTIPEEEKNEKLKDALGSAKFPCKSPDGHVIAKNLAQLIKAISSLGTKKHSQRPLRSDLPAPTVLSLPDDFVHPWLPRTMTVREMARFQSFPDSFEFRSKETTGSLRRRFEVPQYTQVGNAVPPVMGHAVGAHLMHLIEQARDVKNTSAV